MLRLIEPISDKIEEIFKPQGAGGLGLMCAVLLGLPLMSCIKDKHPLNLIFTLVWSCILGVFLAASDLPGAYSRAHAFMIIMLARMLKGPPYLERRCSPNAAVLPEHAWL